MVKYIKQYEVLVEGSQNGTAIPSNFRIVVTAMMNKRKDDDTGFELWLEVFTFVSDLHEKPLINDSFPYNNHLLDLGESLPLKDQDLFLNDHFHPLLDSIYGVGNWLVDP